LFQALLFIEMNVFVIAAEFNVLLSQQVNLKAILLFWQPAIATKIQIYFL